MNNSTKRTATVPLPLLLAAILVSGCTHNSTGPGPLNNTGGMGRIACSIVQANGSRSDETIIDSTGAVIQDLQTHLAPSLGLGAGMSAGSGRFAWIAEDSTDPGGLAEVVVSDNNGSINTPIFETHNDTLDFSAIISADGSTVAFATQYGSGPDFMHYGRLTVLAIQASGDSIRVLSQHVITTYLPGNAIPTLSPDGSQVAFIDTAGVLVAAKTDGSGAAKTVTSVHNIDPFWYLKGWALDWSSQNEIAFAGEGIIRVVSADGGNPIVIDSGSNSLKWSPDGGTLAYMSTSGDIVVTADLGKTKTNLTNDEQGNGAPSWSPDGRKLIYTANLGSFFQQPGPPPSVVAVDLATKAKRLLASNAALGVWLR